jgi:hypothetical protein
VREVVVEEMKGGRLFERDTGDFIRVAGREGGREGGRD